jgi:hypothetical protein
VDLDDFKRINKGMKHCILGQDFTLSCKQCGWKYSLPRLADGYPIWLLMGAAWGFAHEHSDCEPEEEIDVTAKIIDYQTHA